MPSPASTITSDRFTLNKLQHHREQLREYSQRIHQSLKDAKRSSCMDDAREYEDDIKRITADLILLEGFIQKLNTEAGFQMPASITLNYPLGCFGSPLRKAGLVKNRT